MKWMLYVLLIAVGCACQPRQPVDIQALVAKADMPKERAACLVGTETMYQLRKKVCGKNRKGVCSTDWLIDKQHEEIDVCFSNF